MSGAEFNEGGNREPLDRQIIRRRLNQGARNLMVHTGWTTSESAMLDMRWVDEAAKAREQFEGAVQELGENPVSKSNLREWKEWNNEHYLKPIRKQMEQEKKRK